MVQGTKEEIRPDLSGEAWKQKNARQCAACEAVKEKDLATCSRWVVIVAVAREIFGSQLLTSPSYLGVSSCTIAQKTGESHGSFLPYSH